MEGALQGTPNTYWFREEGTRCVATSGMAEVHGNRTHAENVDNPAVSAQGGAVGAQNALIDADLAKIIAAWPDLPDAIKTGILAMIEGV